MHLINKAKKVAIGISGGVDSAVSAYLLKKKYETVGVFMKNWDLIDETGTCTTEKDLIDAEDICRFLEIPFYEANFVKEYWTEVFDDMVADYRSGLTPNPDILCNKKIKFHHFIDLALNKMNASHVATGHYARNIVSNCYKPPGAKLLKAYDLRKDQTFFLSQIPQRALRKTIFPLGSYLKKEVKEIAHGIGLNGISKKKESMGICFIGPRNFQNFISDYIAPTEGNFIDIDTGMVIKKHYGKHNYTIGQRSKISGLDTAYYIALKTNEEDIYLAKGHNHPALFSKSLTTGPVYWIHSEPPDLAQTGIMNCEFRFQHGFPLMKCIIIKLKNNELFVKLDKPLRSLTPGQYAVFYNDDECLGSARIKSPGPSNYTLNISEENICFRS